MKTLPDGGKQMAKICSGRNDNYSDCTEIERLPQAARGCSRGAEACPEILLVSSDEDDASREPNAGCRIGNEYQADLLTHIGEFSCKSNVRNCADRGVRAHLPQRHKSPGTVLGSRNVRGTETYPNGEIESTCCSVEPEEDFESFLSEENIRRCNGVGSLLIHGLLDDCWSGDEKASFLLSLYIFKKNFVEVQRFVETKSMGAIFSYYYGQFYGSKEHCRWSESRKPKSRKCVYGQKIFSGLRLQELLSRICPKVLEQSRNAVLEVSKTFEDEKMTLAEYVFSLKRIVGLNVLVEAVGIGTGRRDLTGKALEPSRSSHVIPVRPEVPTGKSWSSLTAADIVKILNGDYRLSKARSNDLFWEAVWPRLLARGWYSEQHMGRVASSSQSLVFLVSGVKKFTRDLVKGEQYYDSVTDVLSKVAGEPGLIDLGNEESDSDENRQESKRKLGEGQNDLPSRLQHSYLQPESANSMIFTVVDTSLSGGSIRELRTLQSELSSPLDHMECDQDSLEVNTSESVTIEAIKVNTFAADSFKRSKSSRENCSVYVSNQQTEAVNLRNKKDLNDDEHCQQVLKSQLSQKQLEGNLEPVSKRCRRSNTDNCGQMGDGSSASSVAPRLDNRMSCSSIDINEAPEENSSCRASSFQDKLSSTNLSEAAAEPFSPNCQSKPLIDLNFPQVCPEFENSGVLRTVLMNMQDKQAIEPEVPSLPKSSAGSQRQQQNAAPLRHSTRVRPPTIRALEAVADGLLALSPRRRRKGKNSGSDAQTF